MRSASRRSRSGVLPPRTTLSRHGPWTRRGTAATSSNVCGASTNAMSAPASSAALARAIASSKPATARESVRAMTRKSRSRRDCAELGQPILARHDLLVVEMAAFLRKALVLDMDADYPGCFEFAHGPHDIKLVAVAGIRVGDDRQPDRGGDPPGIPHHLRHRNEAKIGVAEGHRGARAGHIDRVE